MNAEKSSMRRLFSPDSTIVDVLTKAFDLFVLNVIVVICCIPIITIGPTLTALYYVTMKMAKGEEGYVYKTFFKAFKSNFKQGAVIGSVTTVVWVIIWLDYAFIIGTDILAKEISDILTVVVVIFAVIFMMASMYFFPLIARFENTSIGTVKNGLLLSISSLPRTMLILFEFAILPIVILQANNLGALILMYGISLPCFLSSYSFVKIFEKIEEGNREVDDCNERSKC